MNTVVITGANRGIGLGFCSHYLQAGWRVIALFRLKPDPIDLAVFKNQESCFHQIEVDLSCK
jgi:NAD(P)-dependent dehydrogenase (short-subunit alcohol dehydrogenase family)